MLPVQKKFVLETCALLLSVKKPEVPERIRRKALLHGLVEKDETHISVAVTKNAKKIAEAVSKSSNPEKLREDIKLLFESFTWEYTQTEEYCFQENFYSREELVAQGYPRESPEHTRRTIVQKIVLPDLHTFYKSLSDLLGTVLPVPVPHITLFSWSDKPSFMTRGIGISSKEEFEACSRGIL